MTLNCPTVSKMLISRWRRLKKQGAETLDSRNAGSALTAGVKDTTASRICGLGKHDAWIVAGCSTVERQSTPAGVKRWKGVHRDIR